MYTEQELAMIREVISRKNSYSPEQLRILKEKYSTDKSVKYLGCLLPLYVLERDLYEKVATDPKVQQYAHLAFFPEIFPLVYASETLPRIGKLQGNRGHIWLVDHPEKRRVIKPFQNSREGEVAQIVSDLEVGPTQYPSIDGFLTEECIEGELFSQLSKERQSSEHMYTLGERMGEILRLLHSRNIYYNDTILTDDFGRSHVFVPKDRPALLFDYGVALRLDHYPDVSDEEVWNYARTFPRVNLMIELGGMDEEKMMELIIESRISFTRVSKEEIMDRDNDFIQEGLIFAALRFGEDIITPFQNGFSKRYRK